MYPHVVFLPRLSIIQYHALSFPAKIVSFQIPDKILLERYLKVSDDKLPDAFALLKHGLELRQKAPFLFTNRDVQSKEIQKACTTL